MSIIEKEPQPKIPEENGNAFEVGKDFQRVPDSLINCLEICTDEEAWEIYNAINAADEEDIL